MATAVTSQQRAAQRARSVPSRPCALAPCAWGLLRRSPGYSVPASARDLKASCHVPLPWEYRFGGLLEQGFPTPKLDQYRSVSW